VKRQFTQGREQSHKKFQRKENIKKVAQGGGEKKILKR
jgi:hypothetical protein